MGVGATVIVRMSPQSRRNVSLLLLLLLLSSLIHLQIVGYDHVLLDILLFSLSMFALAMSAISLLQHGARIESTINKQRNS